MKKLILFFVVTGIFLSVAFTVQARDTKYILPIDSVLHTKEAQERLGSVRFYFGNEAHPPVIKDFGTDFSNRKTNAVGRSDVDACNWAFLSALVTLQARANHLGANAVINVVSYYKKNIYTSDKNFECWAGAVIAGVALRGDFVRVAE